MQYIEAIKMIPTSLTSIKDIEFVTCDDGQFHYFYSSSSTIFKVIYKGEYYSFKCLPNDFNSHSLRYNALQKFISKEDIKFIDNFYFLDNEISIIEKGKIVKYPVLLSKWVNGKLLGDRLEELCRVNDTKSLRLLSREVNLLFSKLLSLDLVHGDLKFDNIVVSEENELFIIDWNGCYLPELKDVISSELGTSGFQHINRTISDYGVSTDDYSIALMVVILTALVEQPGLYFIFRSSDTLLFSSKNIFNRESRVYDELLEAWKYYPLRYRLLLFLGGDRIDMPDLKKIITRLSGIDLYNPKKEDIIDFDEDNELTRIIDTKSKLYGFIDRDKRVVVDTMYGDATIFDGGMAGVKINSNWFFIDKNGYQISEIFLFIWEPVDGVFEVKCSDCTIKKVNI